MLPKAQMRVVGFRWISSKGAGACEACAALHGQEFYFEPGPGQRDAADAPEPPLHPYCKCRLDDIWALTPSTIFAANEQEQEEQPLRSDDNNNLLSPHKNGTWKDPVLGLYWRKQGKGIAPIYGNNCGDHWTGGQSSGEQETDTFSGGNPIDDLDTACADHDLCYDNLPKSYCDAKLITALIKLLGDPKKWDKPPADVNLEDAKKYNLNALILFCIKLGIDMSVIGAYRQYQSFWAR
ncbi:MAG: hypothetical protein KMY53_16720 [Desulfarculus sp.]|nr:hypothetical protein [Pseudomonadota bacterium]MBV1716687.1 hypothetical protein [Desulfarculus sp.]MBU4576248.1 hypothetical protein [Pseudomonadota bacterium]MBU4597010.1 hypothetical protein [Pseudomonadota bacterium]MBV1739811.1 hypothetical protein [Desulfarculus sp.]